MKKQNFDKNAEMKNFLQLWPEYNNADECFLDFNAYVWLNF